MLRKLVPVFVVLLLILQIAAAFTLVSPVMAIIGCLVVLLSAYQWELRGGLIFATLCSAFVVTAHLLSILQASGWLAVSITVALYYMLGVGIGGVLGTIRKQKLALAASEARYIAANLELENEKERLDLTLSSIGDGVIVTDGNGKIIMMNKVASESTGWDTQDAMNRPFGEVFAAADEKSGFRLTDLADDVLRDGRSAALDKDTMLVLKDGTTRNITVSVSPVKQASGSMIGIIAIFRDITELKRAEDAIRFIEKKHSSYIENAPDGVFVIDDRGQYLEANEAACGMTGYSTDELLHMTVRDLLAEESQEAGIGCI